MTPQLSPGRSISGPFSLPQVVCRCPNGHRNGRLTGEVKGEIVNGARKAELMQQMARDLGISLEQVIATERGVIADVRASYSSWRAANAIIASSEAAVSAASLSLEGVRAENTVGNRTILDILNAQQELLRAEVQLVTARRNAYVAGFSLLAAMGKAEARDLGLGEDGVLYDPVDNYDRVHGIVWDWQRDPAPMATSSRPVDIPAPDGEIAPADSSAAGRGD